eukprot:5379687-Pleurochrysis_carterae.AAC.4
MRQARQAAHASAQQKLATATAALQAEAETGAEQSLSAMLEQFTRDNAELQVGEKARRVPLEQRSYRSVACHEGATLSHSAGMQAISHTVELYPRERSRFTFPEAISYPFN